MPGHDDSLFKHLADDFLGGIAGSLVGDKVKDLFQNIFGKESRIKTLVLGPEVADEQAFTGALFHHMRIKLGYDPTKDKKDPALYNQSLSRILSRLDTLSSERQDDFRIKILQSSLVGDKKDQATPDLAATAEVLIGIAAMTDTEWQQFKRALNLDKPMLNIDLDGEIASMEAELRELEATPHLTFFQRLNFLSLTGPSLSSRKKP